MSCPATFVLSLEMDGVGTTIAGRLIDEDDHAIPFTGWVGLTQALRTALAHQPDSRVRPNQNMSPTGEFDE